MHTVEKINSDPDDDDRPEKTVSSQTAALQAAPPQKAKQDELMEAVMGNLLRYGVLLSSLIVLAGGIIYLFRHGSEQPHYQKFTGEPKTVGEIGQLWHAALNGRGRPIIQLGLFVLIATPILRIVTSVIGYFLEKDYLYMAITIAVLLVIATSF